MKKETTLLIIAMVTLVAMGLLMVYSIGAIRHPSAMLFLKHLIFVGIGLTGFLFMTRFDYHTLGAPLLLKYIILASLILLLLTFVPGIRLTMGGAARWIGWRTISFQPSEFAKFALVLLLSVRLAQHQDKVKHFLAGFILPFGIAGFFAGIVVAQRDIGIPLVMLVTTAILVWVAGGRKRYLVGSAVLGVAALTPLVITKSYRWERLLAFLDPWSYRLDTGYQLIQSMSAFAQGGFVGRGPGAGEQKLGYLPAAHTDFIFAMIGEELGFLGTTFVLALFVIILYSAFRIAMNAPDLFGTLLATGISVLVIFQALFIMAVTLGMLPTKGLPLPLVSYGGSALIVTLTMMGILVNIGAQAYVRAPRPKTDTGKKKRRNSYRRAVSGKTVESMATMRSATS